MKSYRKELWFNTTKRREFINITREVERCIRESGVKEGFVLVNAMHITASVFINDDESGLHYDYDVMIIDRMLPKLDGLALIEAVRKQDNQTPVLILSALGEVDDRVKGLRSGGDDYLTKPYAFTELLARVEALTRRSQPEEAETRYVIAFKSGGLPLRMIT